MDIDSLLKQYFGSSKTYPTIDVFDADAIYSVYQKVINVLTGYIDIEISVLQVMSYCFYEVLDNVLTHSGKRIGTVLTSYDKECNSLKILVADDGMGIKQSLSVASRFVHVTEEEALYLCIKDSVTDGKGMGFGLFSTSLLAQNIGIQFEIHSGTHKLLLKNGTIKVIDAELWKGTLVFLELHTNKEIDPNTIVSSRADCATQYNENFLADSQIDELW